MYRLSHGEAWMKSPSGRGGAPRSRQNALKSPHISEVAREYSARKGGQSAASSVGRPENGGGSSGSLTSSGLQETILAHGRPLAGIAGNAQTLSSTITSGS